MKLVLAAGLAPALSSASGWCVCFGLRERKTGPHGRICTRNLSVLSGAPLLIGLHGENRGAWPVLPRPCLGHSEECGCYITGSIETWSRGQESNLLRRAYETRLNPIHPGFAENGRAGGSRTRFPVLPRHGSPQLRPLPDQIAEIKGARSFGAAPNTPGFGDLAAQSDALRKNGAVSRIRTGIACLAFRHPSLER